MEVRGLGETETPNRKNVIGKSFSRESQLHFNFNLNSFLFPNIGLQNALHSQLQNDAMNNTIAFCLTTDYLLLLLLGRFVTERSHYVV